MSNFDDLFDYSNVLQALQLDNDQEAVSLAKKNQELEEYLSAGEEWIGLTQPRITELNYEIASIEKNIREREETQEEIKAIVNLNDTQKQMLVTMFSALNEGRVSFMTRMPFNVSKVWNDEIVLKLMSDSTLNPVIRSKLANLAYEKYPVDLLHIRILMDVQRYLLFSPTIVEPPSVVEPQVVEPPSVVEPPVVEPPSVVEAPIVEPLVVEPPVVEPPSVVEPPVVEPLVVEEQVVEPPLVEELTEPSTVDQTVEPSIDVFKVKRPNTVRSFQRNKR